MNVGKLRIYQLRSGRMSEKRFDLDDFVDKLMMLNLLVVSILSLIVMSYVILTILWGGL